MPNKPIAVIISDVHYSVPTLEVADACMRLAINKANELEVPLVVAGDLHDTKANMRAECVNRMLKTFKLAKERPYLLVGNHDKINEKSEGHSLNFLERYVNLVDRFRHQKGSTSVWRMYLSCYFSDSNELRKHLKYCSPGSIVIMHQGLTGSDSGEYIQDYSALNPEDIAGLRIISGHYHRRQTIKLPEGGSWDYIGNPYTLTFGEADNPEKGFQILMSDGTLQFVPTKQRKHVKFQIDAELFGRDFMTSVLPPSAYAKENDLLWIVVHGTREQLSKVTKDSLRILWPNLPGDFRLTLEPTEAVQKAVYAPTTTGGELLDQLIDESTQVSNDAKIRLKTLWKTLKGDNNASNERVGKKLR